MKFFEFLREYGDSENIIEKLRQQGLLAQDHKCPSCNEYMVCTSANNIDGLRFRCRKRSCEKEKSIRVGSFFEGSKLSLSKCMLFLHLWAKGYSEKLILEDFDFSKVTIVDWSRFCRELCVEYFETSDQRIGGPGQIVEIDETLIVRRKYNRGRVLRSGWLFGGIERRNDGQFKCFMRMVYDRSSSHLLHLIRQHVLPETHIITDGWGAYNNLASIGYQHSVVIHEENFVSPDNSDVHTQTIEATWSSLKRFIRARGGNKGGYYLEYICEYLFRRQCSDTFSALLHMMKQQYLLS
jgi:hypothetical protein